MSQSWIWWKRIKEEITTDATVDQWENKLEEFGVVFSHDEIPEGRTLPLSSMGAFLPCKVKRQSKFTLPFFCFSKKWLASVYERHNESSIISLWKPLFVSDFKKILTIVRFCFWEDTSEASAIFAFAFAFWGLGLAPTRHRVGIFHGSGKVPSVCPCSMLLKSLVFLRHLQNCPWRNEVKSKKFEL